MLSKILSNKLHSLLDAGKFIEARKLIYSELDKLKGKTTKASFLKSAELYGFLIDVGCESKNETDLKKAISFMETCESEIGQFISKQSFYYNLANAKHGLSSVYIETNRGIPNLKVISEKIQPPINLYWLAYKHLENDDENNLKNEILINLSNSLMDAGRIIESIQFLDWVLRGSPEFPQALISRGDALKYVSIATNCHYTGSLFFEMYRSYSEGIKTKRLPVHVLESSIYKREQAKNTIEAFGFDVSKMGNEITETTKEFNAHNDYRRFCLTNFMTLNEHAIYCGCVSAEKDDLAIGVTFARFKGAIVPKLELLLNRLKSEFSLARWLFYQSRNNEVQFDDSVLFSELLDEEVINPHTEMLRTSFRICYGILDKIALGICKFYNLSKDDEVIYFERFWNPGKKSDRWEKLSQKKNIHLNALYSIACDLNTSNGELKHFKMWRNKLEHKALILKNEGYSSADLLQLYTDEDFFSVADAEDFKDKTLHLIQLTRSAIFSFVYLIRSETIEKLDGSEKGFIVDFKK